MQAPLFIAASALCIVGVLSAPPSKPTTKEIVHATSKKCGAQTKATQEQLGLVYTDALPKDEVERCYLECVFAEVGVVKDNKFSEEGSLKLSELTFRDPKEKHLADQLIATCSKEIAVKSEEKCSLGRAVRECFAKHGKEVKFFPHA
uniref:Odorant binding protein 3 n=1 Tax=Pachypeltis micranthus TaxID=1983339 RepID=A0A1W6QYT9_9HEMI|nr:odorant binding protein 3 [Pachypeltis micranthus]